MQRISYLDGTKGICALIVFISHFAFGFHHISSECQSFYNREFLQFLSAKTAVYFFIMISVYLCLVQLKKKPAQSIVLKRYFRLAIPTAISLLFLCGLKTCGLLFNQEMAEGNPWLAQDSMSYRQLGFAILESPFGKVNGWLNVVWMLRYIMYGTLIAVIANLAFEGLKPSRQVGVLIFFAVVLYHYDLEWLNFIYAYLVYIYMEYYNYAKVNRFIIWSSLIALIALEFFPRVILPNMLRACCLVNIVFLCKSVQKVLSLKPFVFLGEISFSIYLLQLPIIYSLSCYLWLHYPNFWINVAVTASVLVGVSTLMTKYIEVPIIRQVDKLINWLKS